MVELKCKVTSKLHGHNNTVESNERNNMDTTYNSKYVVERLLITWKHSQFMFHAMRGSSPIPRPKGSLEAVIDIFKDKNLKELCPAFPKNSIICFCTNEWSSGIVTLLAISCLHGREDSATSVKKRVF